MDAKRTLSEYQRQLGFNSVTRWLHSFRYRRTLDALRDFDHPRVLEIGCADCKLYEVLSREIALDYTGIDIGREVLTDALRRYGGAPNFNALYHSATDLAGLEADVVIALETLEHIPEHEVVRIVEAVAALRPKRFICSVPVEVGPAVWLKNVGSALCGYNRHGEYTWRETLFAGLYQLDRIPAHTQGHKGFDWRWLAQTIRHNMRIIEMRRFPCLFLPAGLSTSIFIVAEPRERHG